MQVDLANSPNTSSIMQSMLEPQHDRYGITLSYSQLHSTILVFLIAWVKKVSKVTNATVGSAAY